MQESLSHTDFNETNNTVTAIEVQSDSTEETTSTLEMLNPDQLTAIGRQVLEKSLIDAGTVTSESEIASSSPEERKGLVERLHTEEVGSLSLEPLNSVFNGLRRTILERRLAQAETKKEKLEKSHDVHKEAARVAYTKKATDKELRPVTASQRRQALRSERRLRKNMSKARINYDLEIGFGKEISTEGQEKIGQRLESERLTKKEKRTVKRAYSRYHDNAEAISKNTEKIHQSMEGKDRLGRILDRRGSRIDSRIDKLRRKLQKLDGDKEES